MRGKPPLKSTATRAWPLATLSTQERIRTENGKLINLSTLLVERHTLGVPHSYPDEILSRLQFVTATREFGPRTVSEAIFQEVYPGLPWMVPPIALP